MNSVLLAYVLLGFSIVSEVIGSSFLVKSEGFTKLFPSVMVFIFLDGEFLRGKGVKISEKEAETPYTSMNSYHRDLSDLTYEKLGIVCEHLVEQLKVDTNIFRLEKADMVKWVVDVYSAEDGAFDLDDLSDKWQKAINRELDSRKVIV